MDETFAIVGLGYVGLPVAVGFARKFPKVIGFDIDAGKIEALQRGVDRTRSFTAQELASVPLRFTADVQDLKQATFIIVAVPTPVDAFNQPDLGPLKKASELVGTALKPGAVIVFESTVYPGVTEEVCGPIIERVSGLKRGLDFKLGYSPERINPGDTEHTFERIVKVVSGEDEETLERVARAYEAVVEAGVHRAPSIKVAEAAKVIENTQRDLNIALMNELALIFDRMGIRTSDVLEAAGTKWNFLRFSPGLVGGHCIGVDPYYLTTKAVQLGYHPEVILAGRRVNDGMGRFIAQRLIKLLANCDGQPIKHARIGILGLTFKENVPDLRNSRVPDIVGELRQFGIEPIVHDPLADQLEAIHEYGIRLSPLDAFRLLDGLVFAVPHQEYVGKDPSWFASCLRPGGVLMDVKSVLRKSPLPDTVRYWCL